MQYMYQGFFILLYRVIAVLSPWYFWCNSRIGLFVVIELKDVLNNKGVIITMNNNPNVSVNFNLFNLAVVCSLVLAVVKLVGLANISWLIVFLPVIAILAIDLVALLVFVVIALIIYLVHRNKKGM